MKSFKQPLDWHKVIISYTRCCLFGVIPWGIVIAIGYLIFKLFRG